jgi:hypothetical protein
MASKWPFMANLPDNSQIRFLESKPLDFPPPPGFLPEALETPSHCSFGESTPGRVPVKILAIDGVAQRDTVMFLRPVTLNKILEAVRKSK